MASERFGGALRRLRDMASVLQSRLDQFKPEPSPLQQLSTNIGAPTPHPPEPTPGTAASLAYLGSSMHDELSRLDSLIVRVQAIL